MQSRRQCRSRGSCHARQEPIKLVTIGGVGDRRRCDGAVSEKQQGSKTGLGSAQGPTGRGAELRSWSIQRGGIGDRGSITDFGAVRGLTIPHHHCRMIDASLGGRLATTTVTEATGESYFDSSTPKTCRLPAFPFLSDGIPTVMLDSASSHAE